MLREAALDQRNDLARQCVGLEGGARRQHARALGTKGLSILGIEVPPAADRSPLVHQHAVALPKFAVEILQPERLASPGVGGELAHGGEEMAVFTDLKREPGSCRDRFQ